MTQLDVLGTHTKPPVENQLSTNTPSTKQLEVNSFQQLKQAS